MLHPLGIIDVAQRAQAVKRWLEVASACDCATVDVCGLFVDPTLAPPPTEAKLDVRYVTSHPLSAPSGLDFKPD